MKLLFSIFLGLGLAITPLNEESVELSDTPSISEEETKIVYTYDEIEITIIDDVNCEVKEGEKITQTTYKFLEEKFIYIESLDKKFIINEDNTLTVKWDNAVVLETNDIRYGDLMSDIEGGKVGDIVTLRVAANPLCKIQNVIVNGVELTTNEPGLYTFKLEAGQNVVKANFVVDDEQMEYLAGLIGSVKNKNWSDIFNLSNLFSLLSWVITICFSSGFFVTLIKNKKIKTKTTNDVVTTVTEAIQSSSSETLKGILEKLLGETFTKYLEKTDSIDETMKVMARCFCLSQEQTPESRLAIIQELTNLKGNQSELTDQVKAIIKSEMLRIEENKKQSEAKLEDLKQSNDSIKIEVEDDGYGKI